MFNLFRRKARVNQLEKRNQLIESQLECEGITIDRSLAKPDTDGYILLKNQGAMLSSQLSLLPDIAVNSSVYEALNQQMYTITLNGKSIAPDQLFLKNNGSYISNLRGQGKHWGKQTDIDPIDFSRQQGRLLASSVFTVASVVTQQYYLKNINDQLGQIRETSKSILKFLEEDKQAQIEADLDTLQDIVKNMSSIKANEALKNSKITQVAEMQRMARANIKFYKKSLIAAIQAYTSRDKKDTGEQIIAQLNRYYYYYRLSLQVFSMSKLVEIMLADGYAKEYLCAAKSELGAYSCAYIEICETMHEKLYRHFIGTKDSKNKLRLSLALGITSVIAHQTSLKEFGVDEKLMTKSIDKRNAVHGNAKRRADRIFDREGRKLLLPFIETVDQMEAVYCNPIELTRDGDNLYLKATREANEEQPTT